MPGLPSDRPPREPFDPIKVSPSRLNSYVSCGQAFKMQYIDRLPGTASGSAALFGSVVHLALEKWATDRTQDLVTLIAQAWVEFTAGTPVVDFLREYQAISVEVMRAEAAARESFERRNKGKPSKAPRMTKEFKESAAAKKLNALLYRWIPVLDAKSPWRFSERDPLPALYDESLIAGKRYMLANQHLPAALHTEFGFNVEWHGFILNGHIDSIEPVLTETGELTAIVVLDYKTYRADPAPAKDWRQLVIYDVAIELLKRDGRIELPDVPVYVASDYFRLGYRKDLRVTDLDRAALLNELRMYHAGITAGVFLPAEKGRNPDFCDYPENCCLRGRGAGTCQPGGLYETPEAA